MQPQSKPRETSRRLSLFLLCLIMAPVQASMGFSLLGPSPSWQTTPLGYNLPGDIGGPMTLSEAYRWNVPTVTYGFDPTFIGYFGTNGVAAVEKAFAILNSLPPASIMSTNLDEYPWDARQAVNFNSPGGSLVDVKSMTLVYLLEQMGLAQPERFVWGLRDRTVNGNPPATNYTVAQMNFDPVSLFPSRYVNGVLYDYQILDPIQQNGIQYASAIEYYRVDPFYLPYSSLAGAVQNPDRQLLDSPSTVGVVGLGPGEFFTGLTRDDVGGLRFLLSKSTRMVEMLMPGVRGYGANAFNFVNTAVRPGAEKITFVRLSFDVLHGGFQAMTNRYSDIYFTNNVARTQTLERVIAQPDILFDARDLGTNFIGPVYLARTSTIGWSNNAALNGGTNGPGVIQPPTVLTFNTALPQWGSNSWGSFDASTNKPIEYPKRDPAVVMLPRGSTWKYLDNGSDQGTNWEVTSFNDSEWASGPAQLGYGDGDEATLVSYGYYPNNKFITTYFRRSFMVQNPLALGEISLRLLRDDGAVIYLNGQEIFRSNMPTGAISYLTLASRALSSLGIGHADETNFVQTSFSASLLRQGTNVLAVEVHQANVTSTDISFDLELGVAYFTPAPVILVNGHYDPSGITIVTNAADIHIQTTFPNGTILYSLDGSPPSKLYAGPFSLKQTATIRAIAYNSNFVQSAQSGPVSVTVLRGYALTATTPGGGGTSVVGPSGFVGWWPGDGSAKDIVDGQNGTLFNGVSFTQGEVGEAFSFDGMDGRIDVEDSDALKLTGSLTIEVWILVKSFPTPERVIGQILFRGDDRGGLDPYTLSVESVGTVRFHIESLSAAAELDAFIETNRFVHIAATLDDASGMMRLYLDGVVHAQQVTAVRPFRDLDPASNPGIGIGNHGGAPISPNNQPFPGFIDELKVYSRALSPGEIRAEFLAVGSNYLQNSTVTVSAIPSPGWSFLQWLGDATATDATIALTMTRNKCIQAVFGTTVGTSAAGNGLISVSPQAPYYPYGQSLTATAVPQQGNYFAFWANAATGTNNPLTFVVTNSNPTITAVFSTLNGGHFALTALASGKGRVTVSPFANTYSSGQAVTLTAQPDADQSFTGWSGSATGTQNPLVVTMNTSRVITGNFTARPSLDVLRCLGQINEDPLQLKLTGTLGEQYRIEGSTNLHDWTVLTTLTNLAGTLQFNDSFPTNKTRFYRGVK